MNGLKTLLAASILATAGIVPAFAADRPEVVLVHGAFADGSSWNKVIPLLQQKGIDVISVQNPLSSLGDDVAAARRAIEQAGGDVVLVGHSWGGTVISEAGNDPRVKALVYVAAFAPDSGQSTAERGKGYPTPPGIARLASGPGGYLHLPADAVASDFAQDLPPAETALIAATQGPIRAANFEEKIGSAAWKTRPSWFVVAGRDRMIDPRLQRDMAKAIGARTTELATSHTPMLAEPAAVAEVIAQAVEQAAR